MLYGMQIVHLALNKDLQHLIWIHHEHSHLSLSEQLRSIFFFSLSFVFCWKEKKQEKATVVIYYSSLLLCFSTPEKERGSFFTHLCHMAFYSVVVAEV